MGRNFWMTCFAIVAVIMVISILMTLLQIQFPETVSESMEEQSKMQDGYTYELKNHQGKLAVFVYGEEKPERVFEVYINTLPEYDKKQLSVGIPIKDYEELLIRLEDYSS